MMTQRSRQEQFQSPLASDGRGGDPTVGRVVAPRRGILSQSTLMVSLAVSPGVALGNSIFSTPLR